MTGLFRYVLLGAAFLCGMASGCYAAASIENGHAQSPEVAGAIHTAAREYGVSEPWLRRIAFCESRYSPGVTSRGGHMGLFQFSGRTWRWMSAQAGLSGASPYDPWSASLVTAWALRHGFARHWSCA